MNHFKVALEKAKKNKAYGENEPPEIEVRPGESTLILKDEEPARLSEAPAQKIEEAVPLIKRPLFTPPSPPQLPESLKKLNVSWDEVKHHDIFNNLGEKEQAEFNRLAGWIKSALEAAGQRSLVISSPQTGGGCSTFALSLALKWARDFPTTKIVLIDANWPSPSINSFFGWPAGLGLSDYLTAQAELEDVLLSPGLNGLHVVPAGSRLDLGSLTLGAPRVKNLIFGLKNLYPDQITIFDAQPVFNSEVLTLYRPTDNFIILADLEKSLKDDLRQAAYLIKKQRITVLGLVMNKGGKI